MLHHPPIMLSVLVAGHLCAFATPDQLHWGDMRVKHAWSEVPPNWDPLGHPAADTTIDLHFALKSKREDALADALYEVSDPSHPKYGAYLSKEQVAELVAPHQDTLELVHSWLGHHGVSLSMTSMTHGGSWLTVNGVPVSQANDLLDASYQLYRYSATNVTVLRTISYGLPAELHAHVKAVSPATYFGSPRPLGQTPRIVSSGEAEETLKEDASGKLVTKVLNRDDHRITPSVLRNLYGTMGYVPAAVGRTLLGILGLFGEYPSPDDLKDFMNEFRTDGADATYSVVQVKEGGYDPSNPGEEASQNIQYPAALAYPTLLIFYSTRGTHGNDDPFLNWLNYLLSQSSIPETISASYVVEEDVVPLSIAKTVCDLFGLLGLRGVSVLISSGDDGVGQGNCKGKSGNVRFRPLFPASCPWVTAVGGTTNIDPEEAASISGGGFSNYFERHKYQDIVVPIFLKDLDTKHKGFFNDLGRGIPDISAQALNFVIICKKKTILYDGTSCSAPTVAGIISLLNDYRVSIGLSSLGFLNPWLYGKGRPGLKDIISGSNPGCGTDGFSAIVGWDPVTGLGTPDFKKLQKNLILK